MDESELREWMVYESLEPFEGDRIDCNASVLSSLFYNANRGKQPAKSPKDFLIAWGKEKQKPSDMRAAFEANMQSLGSQLGEKNRRGKTDTDRESASSPDGADQ